MYDMRQSRVVLEWWTCSLHAVMSVLWSITVHTHGKIFEKNKSADMDLMPSVCMSTTNENAHRSHVIVQCIILYWYIVHNFCKNPTEKRFSDVRNILNKYYHYTSKLHIVLRDRSRCFNLSKPWSDVPR